MPQLRLAEALDLPTLRQARPVVLAGGGALDKPIRWVHATERIDVRQLLRPGDLLLTMGTGLPADDAADEFEGFARDLADVGCVGLVVELGRRWSQELPATLLAACERRDVPVIALTRETRFASVTQEIGERIVDSQLAELRDAQRVHETFTELSFGQAGPAEILEAVQRLVDGAVVLENAQHRPLDYLAGPADAHGFLDGWQARSAAVTFAGRTSWDERNGWLVTRLGSREQDWGRLVVASPGAPSQRLIAVVERAAAALALHHLHDRDRDNLTRRRHGELLAALRESPESDDLARRCELADFPLAKRQFLGIVIRPRLAPRASLDLNELARSAVTAAHGARVPALVCEVDRDIHVLLSAATATNVEATADRIARRIHSAHDVVIAAGRPATTRTEVARTLQEASQVADAVPLTSGADPAARVHRLDDLHLRGLLSLLGKDERLRLFVERELAPIREHDARDPRTDLLAALKALLLHPGSKTEAAASLHLSRAAFYDRLARIEGLLGANLDDPDTRVSLHVAVVADELFDR